MKLSARWLPETGEFSPLSILGYELLWTVALTAPAFHTLS